jgi:hypothetical protein
MKLFNNLPTDLENIIWTYTGQFKLRNGILVRQISHYPPKIVNIYQSPEKHIGGFNLPKFLDPNYMFRLNKYVMSADLYLCISKDIYHDNILFSTKIVGKCINNEWIEF